MAYAKIRPRRGTKSEWEFTNPVLMEGEFGIEYPDAGIGTDICKLKIGNGVMKWTELEYAINPMDAKAIHGGTVNIYNDIWLRSATTEEWESNNPLLALGEIVFDITKGNVKIGDGKSKFTELDYLVYDWDGDPFDFGEFV